MDSDKRERGGSYPNLLTKQPNLIEKMTFYVRGWRERRWQPESCLIHVNMHVSFGIQGQAWWHLLCWCLFTPGDTPETAGRFQALGASAAQQKAHGNLPGRSSRLYVLATSTPDSTLKVWTFFQQIIFLGSWLYAWTSSVQPGLCQSSLLVPSGRFTLYYAPFCSLNVWPKCQKFLLSAAHMLLFWGYSNLNKLHAGI